MSSLRGGTGGHYVVFSPVTKYQLSRIDKVREDRYNHLRFMYLLDPQALIVRIMPCGVSEIAARELGQIIWKETAAMGLYDDLVDMGSMRYQCIAGSKEPDAAFKPKSSRPSESNWPTLVIECGVPKSIDRMRSDANWWLKGSSPGVNIVLLLCISQVNQTIHVEQWERVGVPNQLSTQPNPNDDFVPTLVQTAYIDAAQSVAPSSPMTLDFAKLFLRQPVPFTSEGNIALTIQDLEHCAGQIWSSLRQEII
ncbi:hypothetical protein HOY80DRAFT_941332 [Tuber brumale]|nr:hypothetical protein HOY80DRAFT_941332 [Tuber brumale]